MAGTKAAMAKKSLSSQHVTRSVITEQERHHMIEEAAYYNAEHRGFQSGNPEQDWFLAEEQIEQRLHS